MSTLLVERSPRPRFGLTEGCVVLDNGEIVKEGASDELRDDHDLRRIYLGV